MTDTDRKTVKSPDSGGSSDRWLWLLALHPEIWIPAAISFAVVSIFDLPQDRTLAVFLVVSIVLIAVAKIGLACFGVLVSRRQRLESESPPGPPK